MDGATGGLLLRIEDPFPVTGNQIGRWVAAHGNHIIVGAPLADRDPDGPGPLPPVVNAGVAYVFDRNGGKLLLTIENPELTSDPSAAANDRFGEVAALEGDIVVGALLNDVDGVADAGTVYVFDGKTGALRLTIDNPYPGSGDNMPLWVPVKFGDDILVDLMFDSDPTGPTAGRARRQRPSGGHSDCRA